MSWLDLFRRKKRVSESLTPDDDRGWTRGSAYGAATPLNPDRDELNGEALLNEAFFAYSTNPLAYAIAEQTTSFVLGGGAQVVAKDPRVQKVIDRFWNDSENNMPLRIFSIHTELSVYGEQFIRFFVDPLTGRTIIRQLDPLYVTAIQTSPHDLDHPLHYLYNPPLTSFTSPQGSGDAVPAWGFGGEAPAGPAKPAAGLGVLASAASPTGSEQNPAGPGQSLGSTYGGTWLPATDVLHFTLNKPSGALRGRSDLAPILPWIRRYTEWLENRARLNKLKTNLLWDITVTGGSPEDITRLRATYATPPPPGTVLVHNEREAWQSLHPHIDAGDAAADGRAIRLMVATGAILPEHYLAEGGNANRATAAEMGLPAIKRFKRRQHFFRAVLAQIVNRVLDEAQRAGRLGPRVDRSFSIQLEEISDLPPVASAETLESLSRALAIALEKGLLSQQESRRLWLRFANLVDDSAPPSEETASA